MNIASLKIRTLPQECTGLDTPSHIEQKTAALSCLGQQLLSDHKQTNLLSGPFTEKKSQLKILGMDK